MLVYVFRRLGHLDTFLAELGLGVVDLVNACAKLDSLSGETLLTLLFACSSVLIATFFWPSRWYMLDFGCPDL